MATYTYDQIIKCLNDSGYTLDSAPDFTDFPDCSERTLVTISPEMAQALIDNDEYLFSGTDSEANAEEITLLPNYKVWIGRHILENIVAAGTAAEVYVTMQDTTAFGAGEDSKEICLLIRDAICSLISEHGFSVPAISEDTWLSELPEKLASLNITKMPETAVTSAQASLPTLVGVVKRERTGDYPDSLFILRGYDEQKCTGPYPCNLVPALNESRQLAILPGEYPDFFARNTNSTGLIQSGDAKIGSVVVSDNNITETTSTEITYMCARIPAVAIEDDGYATVGASMSDETAESFFNDLNTSSLVKNVKYIVLDSNSFDSEDTEQTPEAGTVNGTPETAAAAEAADTATTAATAEDAE